MVAPAGRERKGAGKFRIPTSRRGQTHAHDTVPENQDGGRREHRDQPEDDDPVPLNRSTSERSVVPSLPLHAPSAGEVPVSGKGLVEEVWRVLARGSDGGRQEMVTESGAVVWDTPLDDPLGAKLE